MPPAMVRPMQLGEEGGIALVMYRLYIDFSYELVTLSCAGCHISARLMTQDCPSLAPSLIN
jgi:hypothetical protein